MRAPEADPSSSSSVSDDSGPSIAVDWSALGSFASGLRAVVNELAGRAGGSGSIFDDPRLREAQRKLDNTWSGRHHHLRDEMSRLADGVDGSLRGYRDVESELQGATRWQR
jgi:hypothetical protein